ncbi:MAG: hypothetical protein Q7S08_03365 [bacterium]|nr:hypothetical protein [bacterium]
MTRLRRGFGGQARGAKRRVERMRRAGEFLIVELKVRAEDFLNCGFFDGEREVVCVCIETFLVWRV